MKSNYFKNLVRLLIISNICLLLNGCTISRRVENDKADINQEKISQEETIKEEIDHKESEVVSIGEITIKYKKKHTVLKAISAGQNSCFMMPGKELAEFLGLFTDWDSEGNILGISDGKTPSAVQAGNINANVNNEMELLEAAPVVQEGQLFVPISFIIDTYGFDDDLDNAVTTLTITLNADNANIPSNNETANIASNKATEEVKDEVVEEETTDNVVDEAIDNKEVINSPILGFWSSIQSFKGDIKDIQTGITSGQYSGEWYFFDEDGTYQHIIIGSGLVISGSAIQRGSFIVEGNKVKLYDNKESWYPNIARSDQQKSFKNKPTYDKEGTFSIEDGGATLEISFGMSTWLSKVEN